MAKNFKVGIVVGSAVGNALAGLGSVSSSLKILTSNTMDAQSKIQALEKNNKDLGGNLVKEFAKVGAAVGAVAYPAIKMESAMAEVNKAVDFEDENGLDRLKNSLLEMSREIPMAASGLAEITASGGRLGVAEKDLLSYTETVAKIGIAFDMTAAEAGQLMAELSNVYKIPINELDVLGDVINYLSNSFATTPQAVATAMKSFAGGAQSFGLTEKHAAAIATALTSLGISGDVAGTSMRNMLQILNTPEKQSESFKKAFASMGFSIKEFKQATAIDAEGAFLDLFERLGEMPREMRAGLSFDLFGQSNADLANQLGSNFTDTLNRTFAMINEKNDSGTSSYLGSMEEEYLKMKKTTANNLISLKNTIEYFAIVIGDKLLPPINDAINAFKPMIVSTIEWAQANPELVKTGLKVVGMFFGLKLGVLAFNFAIGSLLASTVKFFQNLKAFISGIKVVTMFLMANPIIAIIAGIAIAATLIYVYWEPIKEFFIGIWNTITEAFNGGIGSITALIINWSPLGLFYKAFAGVLGWFGIELPETLTGFGSSLFSGFWSKITAAFDEGIGSITALIINWSPLGLFYKAFAGVLGWFGVELPDNFTEFGGLIIDGFVSGAKALWEGVKSFFTSIIDFIVNPFGLLSPEMEAHGRMVIDSLVGGAKALWEGTKAFFTGIVDFIKNPFSLMSPEMEAHGHMVIDSFVGGAKSLWEGTKSFFTGIVDFIKNPFSLMSPEMEAHGQVVIDSFIGGAKSLWEGTKSFFTDVVDFIKNPFSSIKESFSGYGENIIDGVVGGISNKLSAAKETITNVGSSIKGWFTSVLGIQSPSRVFMGYGSDITAGAAIGITRGLPEARKAIDGLSDEMTLKPQRYQSLRSTFEAVNAERAEAESPIIIHYSPQVTVESGSKEGIQEALKLSAKELEKMLDKLLRDRARRAY